jgi:hypothetical protein
MWGTLMLDVFRQADAADVRDALETVLGPMSGTSWSTGGVYVFWNPDTRMPLYIGITGDFPVRFAQHAGLRSCPASGCKREQIRSYFRDVHSEIGYTIFATSNLSQISTTRKRPPLELNDRELIETSEEFSKQALDEVRALEGRLIADYKARWDALPPWNTSPGRIPSTTSLGDITMAFALGLYDTLLQARGTIREVATTDLWNWFEEELHGARIISVARSVLEGHPCFDEMVREDLARNVGIMDLIRDEIEKQKYLDQRCPLTVGPRFELNHWTGLLP